MNLIQSWKNSLELLVPKNLKTFLLVTGKTILDVYASLDKPLTSRGNWIAVIILVTLIGLTNIIKTFRLFMLESIILNGILHLFFFLFLLKMRSSIGIKNRDYFEQYVRKYWYFLLISLLFGISYLYAIPFFGNIVFLLYMLFLLFTFDSDGSSIQLIIAFKNSVRMLLYNFPIFLVLLGILSIINVILSFLIYFAIHYFGGLTIALLLYILVVPIQIALISNLYIKFIHAQPSLYFNQPE